MDKEVYNTLIRYRKKLESMGVRVNRLILYGSHATGKATKESDIDLIVVSDTFRDMEPFDVLCMLGEARIDIKRPMEIKGLTPEEYDDESTYTFIRDEVKAKGIEVV